MFLYLRGAFLGFLALAGLVLALSASASAASAFGPPSVSELAKKLLPAVVNIGTTLSYNEFGDAISGMPEGTPLGSGFIIDPEGMIVTNYHVIDGIDDILVFTNDGLRYRATIIGTDDKTDLAVLSITPKKPLASVELGDSDAAEIGDWVMAIGNPFGFGGSVSIGIVSARNRDINVGPYDNFIQTDAAINQGNSGGPLFNMDGAVIGINTAIISRTGGALGIGFAVPSSLVKPVIAQLIAHGEVRRGWLGISLQGVTQDIAESLGLDRAQGALIVDVNKGGPSDGVLEDGDVVMTFDGQTVDQLHDLPRLVSLTEVGKIVDLEVLRDGQKDTVTVKLGQLDDSADLAAPAETVDNPPPADEGESADPPGLADLIGFSADDLTPQLREQYKVGESSASVIISAVRSGSEAESKGISPGLLIAEVNQKKVETAAEVMAMVDLAREEGRPVILFKLNTVDGDNLFVAVRLD